MSTPIVSLRPHPRRPPLASILQIAQSVAGLFACLAGPARAEPSCPAVLDRALHLIVVTARDMNATSATLRQFERDRPGTTWRPHGEDEPAVVGRTGLAWGDPFRASARPDDPVKREGDGRTPAGFYPIGRSFGHAPLAREGHLTLRPGSAICVDDPASPHYNAIVPRPGSGPVPRGEDMGAEPLYKRGLVIDYPSDAGRRAGSCIFLHIWRGPTKGTAGCVALPEPRVAALQAVPRSGTVIAILPESALSRFAGCLPAGMAKH